MTELDVTGLVSANVFLLFQRYCSSYEGRLEVHSRRNRRRDVARWLRFDLILIQMGLFLRCDSSRCHGCKSS